jgi:hypothetical protein
MNVKVSSDRPTRMRRALIVQFLVDVAAPLVVFYLLRHLEVSVLLASLVSGAIPAVRTAISAVRGRVDVVGMVMISLFVVGGVLAYVEGDPRIIYAKDGWLTGLLGIWAIISLRMRRPFMLHVGRMIATTKKGDDAATAWEQRWHDEPRFRHDLRLVSCVVGVVLILDAVVRVVIAYVVPLDLVPAVTNVQYVVMLAGLLGWFFPYTARHGLRA